MRFLSLSATANAAGNRIDLGWKFPDAAAFQGVRVVRRESSYPSTPEDGVVVAQGVGLASATDTGLKGETVYYYSLFGFIGDPPVYDIDRHNRVSGLATSSYDHARQMHALLPGVYHRYDTKISNDSALAPIDRTRGQLRRFLDLPGGQLDLLHSVARAALGFHDIGRVDGGLLPLLAQWIAWRTDTLLEIETQRNEIRHAPHLYRTVGIVPTIEATAKRITDWESRTKEFVHNVFRSSNPERLNLWIQQRSGGAWTAPAELLSLDFANEGRAVAARQAGGTLWLLYHTFNKGRWEIWYKLNDPLKGWMPSQPLPQSAAVNKYPAVVLAADMPRAYWATFDETAQRWALNSSSWDGVRWSAAQAVPIAATETRQPSALVDGAGRAWIFWLERVGSGQQLRYSRFDGAAWGAPVTFPLDGTADPRVDADPYVMFDASTTRIWVFWARQVAIAPEQTRWEIAYRVKSNANFDAANWSAVRTLPRPAGADYNDRQPAVRIDAGAVELFWSSNRGAQGYAVWRSGLTNEATNTWEAALRVTAGSYTQRDPLPVATGADLWLVFRSNRSVSYPSEAYQATQLVDFRYSGSTAVDARHADKLALRGKFEDFQTYTYDAGTDGKRDDSNWYARDTVGLYLATDTLDPERVRSATERLRNVIPGFMPVTDRAVFFTSANRQDDYVYTYGVPDAATPAFIGDSYVDALTTVTEEAALAPGEDFLDALG